MSDRREKQLEIVLKLNKLTKEGKISWAEGDAGLSGYEPSRVFELAPRYSAKFKNRRFHLIDLFRTGKVLQRFEPHLRNSDFSLLILEEEDDKEIWIPPMPALDDLADTIQYQVKEDIYDLDEVLKDLEDAENLL